MLFLCDLLSQVEANTRIEHLPAKNAKSFTIPVSRFKPMSKSVKFTPTKIDDDMIISPSSKQRVKKVTQIIQNLEEISHQYDAIFCDIWGVVHNGVSPFPTAVEALMTARLQGKYVALVSNSPRTEKAVQEQLKSLGVPDTAYDATVTAGEVLQHNLFSTRLEKFYFIGRDLDRRLLTDLPEGVVNAMTEVRDIDDADCILLADMDPERPEPKDYEITLRKAKLRNLPIYCGNPDIMVDEGESRIWCGGSVAREYEALGGVVFYFGKPHSPIYQVAMNKMQNQLDRAISSTDILFIGDGIETDIRGAILENMDALFVSGGLAFEDTGTNRNDEAPTPDAEKLSAFLESKDQQPRFTIGALR